MKYFVLLLFDGKLPLHDVGLRMVTDLVVVYHLDSNRPGALFSGGPHLSKLRLSC